VKRILACLWVVSLGVAASACLDLKSSDPEEKADPCPKYCERAAIPNCGDKDAEECLISCSSGYTYYARCEDEYDVLTRCGASDQGVFACTQGTPQTYLASCAKEYEALIACMQNIEPICKNIPQPAPSYGSSCYGNQACNPLDDTTCPVGQACRWNELIRDYYEWTCVPASTLSIPLCEACDYSAGKYCQPGYACVGNDNKTCVRFCCTDSDCGGIPDTCIDYGLTSLTFCATGG